MRLGIISDTHGNKISIRQSIAAAGSVAMWLHAGDYCTDGQLLAELTGLPVVTAAGNCDGRGATAKIDEFLDIGGKKIWLTHGHRYDVKYGLDELLYWGRQYQTDIIVYGHTHIPIVKWHDNIMIFNPGSAGEPRYRGMGTCGVIELTEGIMPNAELIQLSNVE